MYVAQAVEYLLRKYEAQDSNASTTKTKKNSKPKYVLIILAGLGVKTY
jgi:hypothetical protein